MLSLGGGLYVDNGQWIDSIVTGQVGRFLLTLYALESTVDILVCLLTH